MADDKSPVETMFSPIIIFLELRRMIQNCSRSGCPPEQRKTYIDQASKYVSSKSILASSVQYYTKLWGKPEKVNLTDKKWIEVCQVEVGEKINWLSIENFRQKNVRKERLFPSAISKKMGAKYGNSDVKNGVTTVWFAKNNKNTTVYYWIEKRGK
ncbi:hypothetical protein ACFL0M_10985 [Thermodesulfobacteriota bacterium]